jgi:hypothetical protein
LLAKIVCIAFNPMRDTPNQSSKLGRILLKILGRPLSRASELTDNVRAVGELSVKKILHLAANRRRGF